jgi:hypothetical protein
VLSALWTSLAAAGQAVAAGVLVGGIDPAGTGPQIVGVVPTLSHGRTDEAPLDLAKWGWVHSAIERYYQGSRAIGWYLSRPGHQAQLDASALALHRSYFPSGPSVLLLVDPTSGSAALHAGADGSLELVRQLRGEPIAVAGHARGAAAVSGTSAVDRVPVSMLPIVATFGVVIGVGLWLWAGLPGGSP